MEKPAVKTCRINWQSLSLQFLLLCCCLLAASATLAKGMAPADIEKVLAEAHAKFKGVKDGANADYIPALDEVDPELFGISIVTPDGRVYDVGDSNYTFSIQSINRPI